MKRPYMIESLLRGFIEDMFHPRNGAMRGCRNGATNREIKEFAKREDILKATEEYLINANQLWRNLYSKPINKRTINNSLGNSVKIQNSYKPDTPGGKLMTSSENNVPSLILGVTPNNVSPPVIPNPKITFNIQNAKIGEYFSSTLQVQGETELKKVIIDEILFPEGLGLTADGPDLRNVTGSPLKDGDHKISVMYHFQNASVEESKKSGEFNLFINPDPKSLWKKIDPDPNDPYFKKNEDKAIVLGTDNKQLVAASRRGRSHEHAGTFRDDDFLLVSESGWDILAVADGAGSAKSSRKGSEIAVLKSIEHLKLSLPAQSGKIKHEAGSWFSGNKNAQVKTALYEALGRAAFAAFKAIENEAITKGAAVKDYSTTLILAVHKKMPFGHFFAAYWVGDGGVGVYQKGKKLELLGEVDSGEFAGQTRFLDKQVMTGEEVMKRLRFTVADDFTSLVLMTDGVTDPKFETDNNLSNLQKWDDLWSELEPLLANKSAASDELLKWLGFWSSGNHDDRTIALLY